MAASPEGPIVASHDPTVTSPSLQTTSTSAPELETAALAGTEARALAPGRARSRAIDALRGAVMVLMVLDHARDFFFGMGRISPTDLTVTTPVLFFTRWITHFCAPVFVFLAGTSAFLYGAKRTPQALRRFLTVRGLLLVFLELTVVHFCWFPDPFFRFNLLQVIWVIGWSMVLLAPLTRLPVKALVAIGAVIMLGHNALDGIHAKSLPHLGWLWSILHERASFHPVPGKQVFLSYPLLPWLGVMTLGYGFGQVMQLEAPRRRAITLRLGLALSLSFVVLRAANFYGDHVPWTVQRTPVFTLLSFLNCEKYPPSLLYALMTLGPALCLLAAFDSERASTSTTWRSVLSPLQVLGGVPLFFYVAHLALLRYVSAPMAFARFGAAAFKPPPGHAGSPELDLSLTYLAWIVAVLLLYPAARWFRKKKELQPNSWLRYL
jgi:uncharacterized membrane protein